MRVDELGRHTDRHERRVAASLGPAAREHDERIIEANARDLAAAPGYGLTDAAIDRLRLTPKRIEEIAAAMEQIAELADPIGELIRTTDRPNGLRIDKIRVPLGVVFFIYESRPNVTADAAAICVKAGNAVILRGGKEATPLEPGDRRTAAGSGRRRRACRPMRCNW